MGFKKAKGEKKRNEAEEEAQAAAPPAAAAAVSNRSEHAAARPHCRCACIDLRAAPLCHTREASQGMAH